MVCLCFAVCVLRMRVKVCVVCVVCDLSFVLRVYDVFVCVCLSVFEVCAYCLRLVVCCCKVCVWLCFVLCVCVCLAGSSKGVCVVCEVLCEVAWYVFVCVCCSVCVSLYV